MTEHRTSRIEHQASRIALFMASKALDKRREPFKNPLLLVQTNPISFCAKITPTPVTTKDYGNTAHSPRPENEPKRTQSNPKQSQSCPPQADSKTPLPERTYAEKPLSTEIRAKPKQTQTNPTCSEPVESTCSSLSNLSVAARARPNQTQSQGNAASAQ